MQKATETPENLRTSWEIIFNSFEVGDEKLYSLDNPKALQNLRAAICRYKRRNGNEGKTFNTDVVDNNMVKVTRKQ